MLLTACEARISGAPGDPDTIDAAAGDDAANTTAVDASIDAVMLGPWSAPAKVPQASTTLGEDDVTLSSNMLEMIFAINDGANGKNLFYASRASTTAAWSPPVKLVFNSNTKSDETPRLSADNKTLYFASDRGTSGSLDIYSVTHPNPDATSWGTPQLLGSASVDTSSVEKWFMPCPKDPNRYVMVQGPVGGNTHLVEGTLDGGPPALISALNATTGSETGSFLSPDCLTIFFASSRTTPQKIWTSHRDSLTASWATPTEVGDFRLPGDGGNQEDPWMSADGRTFAFASNTAGTKDIYLSTR